MTEDYYDAMDDIYYKAKPMPEIELMTEPIDIPVPNIIKDLSPHNELKVERDGTLPKYVLWCPNPGERPILLKVLHQLDFKNHLSELEVRPFNGVTEFFPMQGFTEDDINLPSKRITHYHACSTDLEGLLMIQFVDAVEALYKDEMGL